MPSQHAHRARTFQPEPAEYVCAEADVAASGKEIDAFAARMPAAAVLAVGDGGRRWAGSGAW
jgi:hypothetical protein